MRQSMTTYLLMLVSTNFIDKIGSEMTVRLQYIGIENVTIRIQNGIMVARPYFWAYRL